MKINPKKLKKKAQRFIQSGAQEDQMIRSLLDKAQRDDERRNKEGRQKRS